MLFNQASRHQLKLRPSAKHTCRWHFLARALLLALLTCCPDAFGSQPSETEIKLVYLYNFTKFVSWPDSAFSSGTDPFRLCILGEPPSQELVASLRTKTTAGRHFDVLFPKDYSDISSCHIAFLHQTSSTMVERILRAIPVSPTLTVSDLTGFASDAGIIEFVRDDQQRVRIRVNISNANKRNLTISAKLLETAVHTYRNAD